MGSEGAANVDGTRGSYYDFFHNNVTCSNVVPAAKSGHPELVNPSHLDHLHMDRYVPMIFCYQLADSSDATYTSFVGRLKSSLAKVLVPFYPMACHVLKTSDPDHPRTLLCDDGGVPFAEAFLDRKFHEVVDMQNFKQMGYLAGFEPAGLDSFKQIQEYPEAGNPGCTVQVTRFNCGAVIVAMNWNHIIADMTAAVQFVTAWADVSRTGSTSIYPQNDRSMLAADESQFHESVAAPPALTSTEVAKIQKLLKTKYTSKILHIRKEAIDRVKQEARQEQPEVSTMDCLCAHLWRSLARVYAAKGISDVTAFTTAVEGRSRMQVSPTYFGNVVASAQVMGIPASELTSKPLSYGASLIRQAIRGITKETYWTIIDQMDLRNPWKTSINRTDYQLGLTSWIRFGLYDIDFGVGKPFFVGVNLIPQCSRKGQCIVLPSALGDGFYSVTMYLPPPILEALWADSEFTSLC